MGIEAGRGDGIALADVGAEVHQITVGLGWDPPSPDSRTEFDLDASAIALTGDDRVPSAEYFVYFNRLATPRGEISHRGDNLTGEEPGDNEQIDVRLDALSQGIVRVVFAVTIHDADYRRQSFGDVANAYIRVLDQATGAELARYDLSTDAAAETAMLFGEVHRDGTGWRFRPLGEGRPTDLTGIARHYGVDV